MPDTSKRGMKMASNSRVKHLTDSECSSIVFTPFVGDYRKKCTDAEINGDCMNRAIRLSFAELLLRLVYTSKLPLVSFARVGELAIRHYIVKNGPPIIMPLFLEMRRPQTMLVITQIGEYLPSNICDELLSALFACSDALIDDIQQRKTVLMKKTFSESLCSSKRTRSFAKWRHGVERNNKIMKPFESNISNLENDDPSCFLDFDDNRENVHTTEVPNETEAFEEDNSSDDSSLLADDFAKKHFVLDSFITRLGMGKFQKQLLCIAVILPRVQVHYDIPDRLIGALSSSVFTGMMFGAIFWGILSDTNGRKLAFNLTLAVTAFFGIFSSFAQSFLQLCLSLFFLGFGVGGNMPVDGALFLEFIPKENQYLLTVLSVFFSFGAVLTSIISYIVLPPNSCPEVQKSKDILPKCDIDRQNNGWRYMLAISGFLTLLMLIARVFLFRLQESPKFLLSNNRKHDAVVVLRKIARINGTPMQIRVCDFPSTPVFENSAILTSPSHSTSFPFPNEYSEDPLINFLSNPVSYVQQKIRSKTLSVKPLFNTKWLKTTLLVWAIWGFVGFAYTMFNVFLPKYLEDLGLGDIEDDGENSSIKEALKDYLIYSICGVPGSLVGAFLIETGLGRKGTMAIATFGTSLSVFLFISVLTPTGMTVSSALVSFLATLNYAVIYGYTPEVFESKLRGTACGISSAVGRISGIIAPVVTGGLLSISISVPLYVSAILFGISGVFMLMLPIETRGRQA
ncbi:hypothetical protein G9A89_011218 [Geosiphon pyriformis]|nr:hypothetical protein G9A89_011218 [Geosiphon pyriformis]